MMTWWKWWPLRRMGMNLGSPDEEDHAARLNEAKSARARSERALGVAHARRRELRQISQRLAEQRQSNGFAERMAESFRSRRQ